jgi:hypothetical protein
MKDIPEMYGITRMNHKSGNHLTNGHWVRIQRNKTRHDKFFSDNEYNGEKGSLEEAKKCRDKIFNENPLPTRAQKSEVSRKKTSSSIVGVTLHTNVDTRRKKRHEYEVWKAWWSPQKGKPKVRSFSVIKYGFQKARQLAIEVRERGLKEMQDPDDSVLFGSRRKRNKK